MVRSIVLTLLQSIRLAINDCSHLCTAMYTLTKSFKFEASHILHHHDGKCARLHGHSYTLTVELSSQTLQRTGPEVNMVTDFGRISSSVKKLLLSHLDHHHLNDTLQTDSPTAEYIAAWCFKMLKPALPQLSAVTIQETATSSATFRPTPHPAPASFCPHCFPPTENGNGTHAHANGTNPL